MKYELFEQLKKVLEKDERLVAEGELLRNRIVELARQGDALLLKHLLADAQTKSAFFTDVEGVQVFDSERFVRFVNNKEFLPDSYTAFKNKIGLAEGDEFVSEKKEVVLNWPYKDCVLEGGQTKEDAKRDEVFWNETLAPDQIHRLLDPKVFTDLKRIDAKGEHPLDGFKTDENGDIKDNLIVKGNNLLALHSLKARFAGKVKLIYIDPPYNTGGDTFGYNDKFNHSAWLTFMRNRLEVAKELLANDGSIWINIDDNESHYLKVLCDGIFGRENFVANIVWRKTYTVSSDSQGIPASHDDILVYQGGSKFTRNLLPRSEKQDSLYKYDDGDGMGLYRTDNLSVKTYSKEYDYEIENPTTGKKYNPPAGRCWVTSREKIGQWIKENRVFFGKDGKGAPQLKRYLKEVQGGIVPNTWWDYDEVGHNDQSRKEMKVLFPESIGKELFATPKPERLLQRIVHTGTKDNDLVLDFFAGSGTTLAVAHKMGRQYIGVEQMEYIHDLPEARLKKVIAGEQGGISKEVGWKGGGDFVYAELMPLNQVFKEKVEKAKDPKELAKVWDEIQEKGFLSYKLDMKEFNKEAKDFAALPLADQKRFILESLDYNQLYVNKSEIEDVTYTVSAADKKLNKEFYG